jgi:K+-transporting ATPase ATPase A chain
MTLNGVVQIAVYLAALIAVSIPLGFYMADVYSGTASRMAKILGPIERLLYKACSANPDEEFDWKQNAFAMLIFNVIGVAVVYVLQRIQNILPLNPLGFGAVAPDSSFNTAVSFVTNTNWQGYAGESTMSQLTQMAALTVQNFLSAATGMVIAVQFFRGIARHTTDKLGNFWVDLVRSTLYILLPLSMVFAVVLVANGVPQTFTGSVKAAVLDPAKGANGETITTQELPLGPVASQTAIKHIGTNGGGYYNANSAHPFENPSPLTDLLLILAETALPAALCITFGKMVGDLRQGWSVLAAMLILMTGFMVWTYAAEAGGNPLFAGSGISQRSSSVNPGGNMEGKEVRFGIVRSAMFATVTTATSCGAVNSMHDSFTPLGGLVPLVMMHLGEVVLGGVGSGIYGMLTFVLAAVFVAGLLVGRTPEYLGKKIESFDIKMISLLILIMPMIVLIPTGIAVVIDAGVSSISNPGVHGFSEILYAFTSQANNNGSAFAGLNANTVFYNLAGAVVMFIGRFWLAIPALALAGSLASKKLVPAGAGTLPTHTPLFVAWLIAIILIVGALNFLPALALGPIVEHLMMIGG